MADQLAETAVAEASKSGRQEASREDYLAAQLHEARTTMMTLRSELLNAKQVIVQRDQVILQREQTILALEAKLVEEKNRELREVHGLGVGRSLQLDEETGKVYWVDAPPAE